MNLTFRQIECFRHVMLLQSTMAASHAMGISQPSVSRAIVELEKQVGFALFMRDGNRMKPTSDALALYQSVQGTIDGLLDIGRTATAIKSRHLGHIRIICMPAFLDTLVAASIGEFSVKFPELRFEIEMGPMQRIIEEVGKGRFELGIGACAGDNPALRSLLLERRAVCVVAPPGMRIGRDGTVSWLELSRLRLIGLLPGSPFRQMTDAQFHKLGLSPDIVLEACTQSVVLQLVQTGAGVGLVDEKFVPHNMREHVQILSLETPLHWDCCLIFPRRDFTNHALRHFIDLLRQRVNR